MRSVQTIVVAEDELPANISRVIVQRPGGAAPLVIVKRSASAIWGCEHLSRAEAS